MGKFLSERPTLRGFLIIGAIALVVVVLNLYTAVIAIGMLIRSGSVSPSWERPG